MADGSKQAKKQTEPEAEQPSKVRLAWERDPAIGAFSVNTHCALLMVDRLISEQKMGWRGSVTATGFESKFFVSQAEAQLWCESQLAELLRKDLERLGGGENITLPIKRTTTPGVLRLRLGEFDLNQEDGSSGIGELFLHASGSAMIVRMPNGVEFTIEFSALVSCLAAMN